MIVDFLEFERKTSTSWFLVSLVSTNNDIFDEEFDSSNLDIQCSINGHTVDLMHTLSRLEEEMNRLSKEATEKEDIKEDIITDLESLIDKLKLRQT
tara:strand:- start:9754 stop:10041 length:288 start_codon:yes stop_codon:yes gene_type:complete